MLTIESTGDRIEVTARQTILDAALRSGVWLPHACGHGTCGTCKVEVLEGDVTIGEASPFALMDVEREEGKCLACCTTLESDVVIEADIEEDPDARIIPLRDFTGTVEEVIDLTPTVKGIFVRLPGEGIEFQSGQYVNVTVPGLERPRAFSLANPASERHRLELNVRRVEEGAGTAYMHERLAPGQELRFTGPWGRFYVRRSDPKPILFVAGGSGLSCIKSMLLDLLESGDRRPLTLVQGARNLAELYYRDRFETLASRHPNFIYIPALSDPLPGDEWQGATSMAHEAARDAFDGRFQGMRAYLCGPPPMIEACIRVLMRGRLFEKDIFTEKFVTAADGESALAGSPLFKRL